MNSAYKFISILFLVAGTVELIAQTPPPNPPNPIASTNTCGNKTISRDGTPPTKVVWYWQSTALGTSQADNNPSITATSSGTYYLRAYNFFTDVWSTGSGSVTVTVNQYPLAPSAPSVQGSCGVATLTRGNPPGGVTWYWQGTNSAGTSIANSNTTYDVYSSGTYYLRAMSSAGCWSATSTGVSATVDVPPATPGNPTSSSNTCGNKLLTRSGSPPQFTFWYWQTSASGTSTSNPAPDLTATSSGTYYLRAYESTTGCWSIGAGQITVTVNPYPATPSTPSVSNQCGVSVLSVGSPPPGQTWYWQGTNSGGTDMSNSSSSYNAYSSATYYIRARDNATGCWSESSAGASTSFNPLPDTPWNPSIVQTCGTGIIERATPPPGITWYWQGTNSSGTSTGDSNTTYSVGTASGTYYLRARNNTTGCWSASSSSVAITVNPNPGTPSIPTLQQACGTGILGRGTPPPGITWYWQGTNSSGTSISDSNTTYSVGSTSGTYYLRARDNSSGCWSPASSSFTITVYPLPGTPSVPTIQETCGTGVIGRGTPPPGITWYWQGTNSSGTSTGDSNTTYSVGSTSGTYYLRARDNSSGCWSASGSSVAVTVNPLPGTPSAPTIQETCGTGIIARGTPPPGITWYWQGTNSSGTSTGDSNTTYSAGSTSGTYYLRARNNTTGCWSASGSSVAITVNPLPATPSVPTIQETCGTGIIARGTPPPGITWYWQGTNSSGTSTGDSNTTYSTGSTSGTYYLRARNNTTGCWSASSSSVAITVNTLPATPSAPTIQETCGTGIIERATPPPGITWYWQGTNSSGTSTGDSNTTYSVGTTSGTYYLRARNNTTGCWSASGSSVAITVNPAINNPLPTSASREEPGIINLNSTIGDNGTQNLWYDAPEGGTLVASTQNYGPTISVTTSFYVASHNPATTCTSARVLVTGTVNPKPVIGPPGGTIFLTGTPVTLSASNNTYTTYNWKRDNVTVETNSTHTTSLPGIYTLTVTKTGMTGEGTSDFLELVDSSEPVNRNAVAITNIIVEGVVNELEIEMLEAGERQKTTSFIGGLGNTLQTILSKGSPQMKDVVQPVQYDVHGRQLNQYLPYVSPADDSKIRLNALDDGGYANSEQYEFYQQTTTKIAADTKPYTITEVEPSPFQRVKSQTGVGESWHAAGKKVQQEYLLNRATDYITAWSVNASGLPVAGSSYGDYQLFVLQTTDENGNPVKTYTDKLGRPILKAVEQSAGVWALTYSIYNIKGQLAYTITPQGLVNMPAVPDQTFLDQWAFQYRYDDLGRLVEYKAPDGGWIYTVYDKLDRAVFTQNADLRSRDEWAFVKYDIHGRPVLTGIKEIPGSTRASEQSNVDAQTYTFELTQNDATGYTLNRTYPTVAESDLLTVAYYDNYAFLSYTGWDAESHTFALVQEQGHTAYSTGVAGLATGGKVRILNSTTWLNAVQYYDAWYRPIQTLSENQLGGLDRSTIKYNSLRQVAETKETHSGGQTVTVLRKYTYDHAGRLLKIHQNINSAATDQLVAQYEYNELGQLVDKKLHEVSSNNFLQSVDYRYTIRGWMKSINNAQLTIDNSNDDPDSYRDDYFGMEFDYNTVNALGNMPSYNGNISAMRWKGAGMNNATLEGTEGERGYVLHYDKGDRLTSAIFYAKDNSQSWTKQINAIGEFTTYDRNGNITTLDRMEYVKGLTISGGGPAIIGLRTPIDQLSYTYASGNQLSKVEDFSGAKGFNNAVDMPTEYTYNTDGAQLTDLNKGITGTIYNRLGKPEVINFSDGRKVEYVYSATGIKLQMKTYATGTVLQTTTDYVNGFVYENSALKFFGSPEGRIVKNGGAFEYQYSIADHQGNTRVVFSSVTPTPENKTATFEGDANDNVDEYLNVEVSNVVPFVSANHTPGGLGVVHMNQTYKIGPARNFKVYPGDQVDIEVWEYHESASGYGTNATPLNTLIGMVATVIGGVNGGAGEAGMKYNGVNSALSIFGTGGNQGDAQPAAYLNYILFDKDYKVMDAGWQLAPATTFTKQKISFTAITVKEAGYLYTWLSYDDDSNNWVYFDDFKVTQTKNNIIQYSEYYPFGLQTASSWTREDNKNDYLYNEGSELNNTTGFYEMHFRDYDPVLGRMNSVDPYASAFATLTPYNYAGNNPISMNDPSGGYMRPNPEAGGYGEYEFKPAFKRISYSGMSNDWGWSNAEDFIAKSLNSEFGGEWSGGLGQLYDEEDSDQIGISYTVVPVYGYETRGGWTNYSNGKHVYNLGQRTRVVVAYNLVQGQGGHGALFNSMDDAATDWGMKYNDNSIISGKEFASTIYERDVDGKTFYSYTKPRVGSEFSSNRSRSGVRYKDVGDIHSHGKYHWPSDNKFSPSDIKGLDKKGNGWTGYLTTPGGYLWKYSSGVEEDISIGMPSDSQAGIFRMNSIDAALGPKNEPTFGLSDWIQLIYPGTGWRAFRK